MSFYRIAGLVALVALSGTAVSGQDEKPWTLKAELGASVFFGASEQAAVTFGTDYDLKSETLEFETAFGFDYGESQSADGDSYVNQRAWASATTLDYLPSGQFSPFVIFAAEGSFARQIDRRFSGGLGAKWRLLDSDVSKLDFSLAGLIERTEPTVDAGAPDMIDTSGRWSLRGRVMKSFDDARLSTQVVTFYRPAMSNGGSDYTLDVNADLTIALTGVTSLKIALVNKYDAQAETRGARSNNDGRLFVSIIAEF